MRESFEDHGQYRWVITCGYVVGGKISTTYSKGALTQGYDIFVDSAPQSLWDAMELKKGSEWIICAGRMDCFFNKTAAKKELFMRKLRGEYDGA